MSTWYCSSGRPQFKTSQNGSLEVQYQSLGVIVRKMKCRNGAGEEVVDQAKEPWYKVALEGE